MRTTWPTIGCLVLCAGILVASSCTSHSFLRTKTEEVERPDGTKEKSTSSTSGRIDALNGEGVSGFGDALSGFFTDPVNALAAGGGAVALVWAGVSRVLASIRNKQQTKAVNDTWDEAYINGVLAGRAGAPVDVPSARKA